MDSKPKILSKTLYLKKCPSFFHGRTDRWCLTAHKHIRITRLSVWLVRQTYTLSYSNYDITLCKHIEEFWQVLFELVPRLWGPPPSGHQSTFGQSLGDRFNSLPLTSLTLNVIWFYNQNNLKYKILLLYYLIIFQFLTFHLRNTYHCMTKLSKPMGGFPEFEFV